MGTQNLHVAQKIVGLIGNSVTNKNPKLFVFAQMVGGSNFSSLDSPNHCFSRNQQRILRTPSNYF
jgi:hypothetical protein